MKNLSIGAVMLSAIAFGSPPLLVAETVYQHGTHEHGIAHLNLAREGNEFHIELDSPAANIVGFEYAPAKEEDRAVLDKAMTMLHDGERLFRFPKAADCRLSKAEIETPLADTEHHEDSQQDHDQGHHHDDHSDGDTHADIIARYQFYCEKPDLVKQIDLVLFQVFLAISRLKVQFVVGNAQGATELTALQPILKL